MAYLSYVKVTNFVIGRIFKADDINHVFKPTSTVRNLIRPVRDNIPLATTDVYEVPSSSGFVLIEERNYLF